MGRNKDFICLMVGQAVSQVGDKLHLIALVSWVLSVTGSPAKMGLVLAVSLLPSLILGLVSGAWIDRYPVKRFLVGPDVIRGILLVGFGLAMIQGEVSFAAVLVLQALLSVNAAFFDPAVPTAIPRIVEPRELTRANSLHQSIAGLATVVGACLGGLLAARLGYGLLFFLNGISFLISGAMEARISIPDGGKAESPSESQWDMIKSGYAHILGHALLPGILFMVMVIHAAVGGIEVLMPVMAHDLARDGAKLLGFAQAAFGSGAFLVGALASATSCLAGRERLALFGGVAAMGLVSALGAWGVDGTAGQVLFLGMVFCWGGGMMVAAAGFRSLIQMETREDFRGRVFALAGSLGNASLPLAMAGYGMVLNRAGHPVILGITGLSLVILAMIALKIFNGGKDERKEESIQP